ENVKKNIKVEKADMKLADIPICHRPEKGKSGPALKINLVVDDAKIIWTAPPIASHQVPYSRIC
ncbi:63_t:CDS:2, partial [Entrophospora sp. SA101]